MTKKRVIDQEWDIDFYIPYNGSDNHIVGEFLKKLETIKAELSLLPEDTIINILDSDPHDDLHTYYNFRVTTFRDETDKEYNKRMANAELAKVRSKRANLKAKEAKVKKELEEYERLKKKFCPEDK